MQIIKHRTLETVGRGTSKKAAKTEAAANMLRQLAQRDVELDRVNEDVKRFVGADDARHYVRSALAGMSLVIDHYVSLLSSGGCSAWS